MSPKKLNKNESDCQCKKINCIHYNDDANEYNIPNFKNSPKPKNDLSFIEEEEEDEETLYFYENDDKKKVVNVVKNPKDLALPRDNKKPLLKPQLVLNNCEINVHIHTNGRDNSKKNNRKEPETIMDVFGYALETLQKIHKW